MVDSLQIINSTILRDTLLSIPEIPPLVLYNGQHKIFWEHVEQGIPLPYIVTRTVGGGDDNDAQSRATDSYWRVEGYTGSMVAAVALSNAISKLHRMMPNTDAYDYVSGYTWIEEITAIFDRSPVQNIPLFVVGGMYRLRLSILPEV